MVRIRVLVVDDHRIFAESLAAALAAEPDVEVAAAGSGPAALRCLERAAAEGRRFDVMLVDADLGTTAAGAGRTVTGTVQAASAPVAGARGRVASGAQGAHGGQGLPGTRGMSGVAGVPAGVRAGQSASGRGHGGPVQAAVIPATAVGPAPAVGAVGRAPAAPGASAAVTGRAAHALTAPTSLAGAGAAKGAGTATATGETVGELVFVDGLSLVAGVRTSQPSVHTVVLAERDDPRRAALALQAGASGWVAKDCSLQRLLAVIRGVLRDETHLPPALLTGVLRELTAARKHRTESERLVESLTPRAREVLRCMVAGLGRKAVAERLFLSPHTVRTHMQNVLGKLGVHSTLAAVALARRAGVGPAELAGPGDVVERGGQLA
jgi:DNA-binding NarL/FixJ family response regulator